VVRSLPESKLTPSALAIDAIKTCDWTLSMTPIMVSSVGSSGFASSQAPRRIRMRLTGIKTLHLHATLEAGSPSDTSALLTRGDAASSAAGERPDSRYWLDYDYFMLEREARAVRRAYIYSLLVRLAKRLSTRLSTRVTGRTLRGA
jgi:hypothetical protein